MAQQKIIIKSKRTLSRLIAMQILYQYRFFAEEKPLADIKKDVIENYALSEHENISSYREKIDIDFLNNLVDGASIAVGLESEISELLKNGFALENLEDVMRQILILAAFELKFMLDTQATIIIVEYVDIAASFFDEKKVAFVNGILQNLAKKLRSA
jgi:N utilization substance protein B